MLPFLVRLHVFVLTAGRQNQPLVVGLRRLPRVHEPVAASAGDAGFELLDGVDDVDHVFVALVAEEGDATLT